MQQTIDTLQALKEEIMTGNLTPDELSRKAVEMSGHLIRLGEFIAQLVYDANSAYIYRKYQYAFQYSSLSKEMTVKDREYQITLETKEHHQSEIEKRRTADRVKTLHEDYRLFVMVIQSRLGVLKSELFEKKEI